MEHFSFQVSAELVYVPSHDGPGGIVPLIVPASEVGGVRVNLLHHNAHVLLECVEVAIVIVPHLTRAAQFKGRCKVFVDPQLLGVSQQVHHKVFKGDVLCYHSPIVLPQPVLIGVGVLEDVTPYPVEVWGVPLKPQEGPAAQLTPINAHHPLQGVAVHNELEIGGQRALAFLGGHAEEGSPDHDVLQ